MLNQKTVTLDGKNYPLAGDFTAAVATAATPSGNVGFIGLVRPAEEKDKEGLYLLEPFRKDRIPLILVHGLFSSPRTCETVINSCYGNPVIREHYQIMVFFYPTGFPIAENSAILRDQLNEACFKANTDISRVVFICGPHRGSPLANDWLGAFAIDLIRIPFNALNSISGNMIGEATGLGKTALGESRSSIGNLSVDSPVLLAILKQPMPRKSVLHSIIGDRGMPQHRSALHRVDPFYQG